MEDTKAKQAYLRQEIIGRGFDPNSFVSFLSRKKDNGVEIEAWTHSELKELVAEFVHGQQHRMEQAREPGEMEGLRSAGLFRHQRFAIDFSDDEDDSVGVSLKLHRQDSRLESTGRHAYLSRSEVLQTSSPVKADHDETLLKFLTKSAKEAAREQRELVVTEIDKEFESVLKCSKYPESELDDPNLKSIITSSRLVKGGLFTPSFVTYDVYTKPLEVTVERRYSDFYWLRSILVRDYMGVYVNSFHKDTAPTKEGLEIFRKTIPREQVRWPAEVPQLRL